MIHKALNLRHYQGCFVERTIHNILNRLGYTLKKVLKTKPHKKIEQTDAIFENVQLRHQQSDSNPRILRISIDTKAKVKIGKFSRSGYSRELKAPVAMDHDQKWEEQLVPFGVYEFNTNQSYILFGNSKETSNFIGDSLEWWSQQTKINWSDYDLLMIDLDNGQSLASKTRLFQQRIVNFAKKIQLPIQLVYYPPYHSKYNPVERVWAALENYWRGLILDTVENTLKIAEKMTWKAINPIVGFLDKEYYKGVKVSNKDFNELQQFIERNPKLEKWDVKIKHQ